MILIDSLDHSGRGIAKLDNKVVFVENAIPGEIVNINVTKDKKNYIEANVASYIKKSKKRVDSPCPYFNICGGCDLLHLSYPDMLAFKQEKIENIVSKYVGNSIKINKIVKSSNQFNYRNKVTFQVKETLGFYNSKSHKLVQIDKCIISSDIINNCIKHLKELNLSEISKITCRTNLNELMIIIETKNQNLNIDAIKKCANSIYLKVNDEYKLVYGNEYIIESVGKYKYLVSPDSFFQINLDICLKLYSKVNEYIGTNKNVLDLYCGTGTIGIFVSSDNNVLGVEINKFAIQDAIKNKEMNNIENIEFICGDSGKIIDNLDFKPDVVIVDPPRAGLNKETIDNIIKLNPNTLIYVSCDPMTLARDLNLLNNNFNINEITPFDMFPNTKHVECVSYLTKR